MRALTHALDHHVPPHSIEAEMSALGAMMLSERAVEEVAAILRHEDFYRPAHRDIFDAMLELRNARTAIDMLTVKNELQERGKLAETGGTDYLIQIVETTVSPANAGHYANIVRDKATLRQLIATGQGLVGLAQDPGLDTDEKVQKAEQMVFEVGQKRLGKQFEHVKSLAFTLWDKVDKFYETGQPLTGTPSGFYDLDRMTGGFYPSDLTIVAARPSVGKTALVLDFALGVARQQKGNVAIFSLEMSGEQLVRRLLGMISGVSMGVLKQPRLQEADYQSLLDACEVLYGLPVYVDDTSEISAVEMRGKCRRLKADGGLALVVVDYLQLMRGHRRTENKVQEITDIVRALKALAKDLDVPVVALSQLNRAVEGRKNRRPMLSDIRESGSIEAEADLVIFIYREDYYERNREDLDEAPAPRPADPEEVQEAEIILAKHRNGPVGTITLAWQAHCARFKNLKREP
jgi:replicative DNA helicase